MPSRLTPAKIYTPLLSPALFYGPFALRGESGDEDSGPHDGGGDSLGRCVDVESLEGSGLDYESVDGEEDSVGKSVLNLAVPALLALSIDPLMTIADTFFVGRFPGPAASSAEALAGMGSASALLTISFYIFNFLTTATAPLVGRSRSEGDDEAAARVASQSLSLAIILGSTLTLFLLTLGPSVLLDAMGAEFVGGPGRKAAEQFVTIRSFAAIPVLLSGAATGILRGFMDTVTPTVVLTAANLVNLGLDVILVQYGGMGAQGAAIATTLAEWICAVAYLVVLAGVIPSAGLRGNNAASNVAPPPPLAILPSPSVPPWAEIKPLVVASSAVFLRTAALQLALVGAAAMAARSALGGSIPTGENTATAAATAAAIAAASVAAHQIALQLWILCSFVTDSLAAASQALIADAVGKSDPDRTRNISRVVFLYGAGLGAVLAVVLGAGAFGPQHILVESFTADSQTREALSQILFLVVLAQPLNAFVFTSDGILQGASEFIYQAKTMALSVLVAALSFLALQKWEVDLFTAGGDSFLTLIHVWESLIILQIMRGLTSWVKLVDSKGPINLM